MEKEVSLIPVLADRAHKSVGLERRPCQSCAPGARTIRMCSLDGRSWTATGIIPMDEVGGKVPRSMRAVGDQPIRHVLEVLWR